MYLLASAISLLMLEFDLCLMKNFGKSSPSARSGLSQMTSWPRTMVWLADLMLEACCLVSSFSETVRSKGASPRLLHMALQTWEWKKRAIPLKPRLPSP